MGTRSLTVLHTEGEDSPEICVMYRQMDGYPSGHGQDLADFLKDIVLVNGIRGNEPTPIANGMECLAAQVVAHFKNGHGVGDIYLHPGGTRDCWEEYVYHVYEHAYENGPAIHMTCETADGITLYDGFPGGFDAAAASAMEDD